MSSCRDSKPTRTLLGLASLASVQTSISAHQPTSNSLFRSLIPVLSVAASQAQPSIPSRINARTATVSASMPKKTEDLILKHVQRVSTSPSYCWFCGGTMVLSHDLALARSPPYADISPTASKDSRRPGEIQDNFSIRKARQSSIQTCPVSICFEAGFSHSFVVVGDGIILIYCPQRAID
jgi:hypothetical protein